MSKLQMGRGAVYLYIETISSIFSASFFWFILSKIANPEAIGTSSAVISFAGIFGTLAALGGPAGAQRFLGKSFYEGRLDDSKVFIKSSLLVILVGIIAADILTLIFKNWWYNSIDFSLTILAIILVTASPVSLLFRNVVISSMKTQILPVISIVSTAAKVGLGIILVLSGIGSLGIVLGYTSYYVLSSILLAFVVIRILKQSNGKANTRLLSSFRTIFTAGMANWIPGLIATIGAQLGTIVVISSRGANQAGYYFIALSVVTAVSMVMSALPQIAYPTLSAMTDGRKRFGWRVAKITLIVALPFSCSLLFYPKQIMDIFGTDYSQGSTSLVILLLSMLPFAILTVVSTLSYSYGNLRQVLIIGIATNVPRAVLYFVLVPIFYGSTGAAISYTIGTIVGLIVSVVIAKKIGMLIFWKDLAVIFVVPTGLSMLFSTLGISYLIGIFLTLVISYIFYLKLHILDRVDLQDIGTAMPSTIGIPLMRIFNALLKKLDPS